MTPRELRRFSLAEDVPKGLLAGQVALVTGAGRGNGRAIAIGLARAGAALCVADLDEKTARVTCDEITAFGARAIALRWNVAEPGDCSRALERIRAEMPELSILVNNAGVESDAGIGEPGYVDSARRVFDVNLEGAMRITGACIEDLRRTRGCIVNISSFMAFVAYQPRASAYAASKAALAQWTRSLANELAPDGIRVNAVAPGFFETAMTAGTRADATRMANFVRRTPLGRMGAPEELVGPVVFLASPLASYVTGVVLPVDGGLLAT